jgi:F-type H+-transporting ATPase subunit delta
MRAREIAYSYAEALWELGAEVGKTELLEKELRRAWKVISESELYAALRHPLIPKQEKLSLVREVFSGITSYVRNLLLLVVERGRVAYLGEILEEFQRLREEREGLVHAQVYSPYPLDGLRDRIRAKLEEITGRKVLVEERLDRSLIGGIKLTIGDLVLDGSIRAQLERLRDALTRQRERSVEADGRGQAERGGDQRTDP